MGMGLVSTVPDDPNLLCKLHCTLLLQIISEMLYTLSPPNENT